MRWIPVLFLVLVLASGCSPHRAIVSSGDARIAKLLRSSDNLKDHHVGFALYDPEQEEWLYRQNDSLYFTPASNTKILTLMAARHFLPDSSDALRYARAGDTLFIKGTGYPYLFWGPDKAGTNNVMRLFEQHNGPAYYVAGEPVDRYGRGWAWDDYPYRFQVERSLLPVYGNRIKVEAEHGDVVVTPAYYRDFVVVDVNSQQAIDRLPDANAFSVNSGLIDEYPGSTVEIPFITSDYDLSQILSGVFEMELDVRYSNIPYALSVAKGAPIDTLLKHMMQESDNFVAEQLLIMIGLREYRTANADSIIQTVQEKLFTQSPDSLLWNDGSGISRYNLFTPRSLVWLLDRLYQEEGLEYIMKIFPAGGVSGTIHDSYANPGGEPYIYAKTGTMRNNHGLSGYLLTRSGRILVFSFMHNNFPTGTKTVKTEMQEVLRFIYNTY